MGGTMSDMTCCARDLGLSSDVELAKVAAATPLHHGKGVTAGLLAWSSELQLVLAAQPGQSLQREEENEWGLDDLQPKVGSISSSDFSTASSKVVAYDIWSTDPAWKASTPVEEILCMAWVPERRLLVCGGAGIKEIAAINEQHQVVWSIDSGIGKACCLQSAPGLDLMICGGKQEAMAFSLDDAAKSSSWEPRWLVNTEFLSLNCLAWFGPKGLVFAAGSHERIITGKVIALDALQGGQERWSATPNVGAVLCCLAAEEPALVFCGGNHAKLAALEPETGEQRWLVDPGVGESRQYGVYSSPGVLCLAWANASGKLLCGGSLGRIAALDPGSGNLLWAVDPGVSAVRNMAYVPEMGGTLCCGASGRVAALVT